MRLDFFIVIFSLLAIMVVTDTAFRKPRLGSLFFKKIIPSTSKNCSYHTDLLVFCLKFKISPACELSELLL